MVSTGGGARAVGHYSEQLFQKAYNDLNNDQKEHIITAQLHDRTWRNDASPSIMASFATNCLKTVEVNAESTEILAPCKSCLLVHTSRSFQNAIHKPTPDPKNLCFVPRMNQNPHASRLYTKFKGREALISEASVSLSARIS
ncbi:hypothetical protein B0H10DRAFT_1809518 [Mycena sp. CBHHK59/15]|nr:hypothetical protein B0H10DRAFT_1809518 [Mycena sp. CBHHK59/15]